jgi:hypothetical protein
MKPNKIKADALPRKTFEEMIEDRLKRSLIDRDWEDIEKDLLPPGKRLEDKRGDVSFMVHMFPMQAVVRIPPQNK